MLSITKINAARNQTGGRGGKTYTHYLGGPTTKQRGDFDDYARGDQVEGPPPFWACRGASLLGLDGVAEAGHVERLARGLHPVTGEPLVKGAGAGHVMGLDMTFSAPKDFSAVFAGADPATRDALTQCLQQSARTALAYAEAGAVTRHGHGGRLKQAAQGVVASVYTHFSSRALDPNAHVHAFLFNVGKRQASKEWSALELRTQFERKMATGILFRVELASRLRRLGFEIVPAGPYFALRGIDQGQRDALSTRSRQIADHLRDTGVESAGPAEREIASLNTRASKAEPPLAELLSRFEAQAGALGITPQSVAAMRSAQAAPEPPLAIDHAEVVDELVASQSCATAQEALALICERAMGRWTAQQCLDETERLMASELVVRLGRSELLTEVFTSRATKDMEADISAKVASGKADTRHRVDRKLVDAEFDRLESELSGKLGVKVSLSQQRDAALHIACDTGLHAFCEGWAGTGKTTMLKAAGAAFEAAGLHVVGCCQSAAASQNLMRETGIPSRTIASLLLSLREGRARLDASTVLVLDEAGMVGSREFASLQSAAMGAGAKLVCVGDPKQLQPIEAGGIFGSLMREHGKAEISNIQRQRTDFEPLLAWLSSRAADRGGISKDKARALRALPEDARMAALKALCSEDAKLSRAFEKWRGRFDFEWMREAVESFAKGDAARALEMLDAKRKLILSPSHDQAVRALISAWDADKTPVAKKAIVAGTRAEVAELNAMARERLIEKGVVEDIRGIEIEIKHRDDTVDTKRFAPGDRVVFTMNDRSLGVANGVSGTVQEIGHDGSEPVLEVELDDANERNETRVRVPASFGRFDLGLCLTNHKSQGRTFDAAYVLANPAMADREWTYVAASRSRFATTLFANTAALGLVDPESHRTADHEPKSREQAIEALASRMRRSRAKGTTLDYAEVPRPEAEARPTRGLAEVSRAAVAALLRRASELGQQMEMRR